MRPVASKFNLNFNSHFSSSFPGDVYQLYSSTKKYNNLFIELAGIQRQYILFLKHYKMSKKHTECSQKITKLQIP